MSYTEKEFIQTLDGNWHRLNEHAGDPITVPVYVRCGEDGMCR